MYERDDPPVDAPDLEPEEDESSEGVDFKVPVMRPDYVVPITLGSTLIAFDALMVYKALKY